MVGEYKVKSLNWRREILGSKVFSHSHSRTIDGQACRVIHTLHLLCVAGAYCSEIMAFCDLVILACLNTFTYLLKWRTTTNHFIDYVAN